MEIEIGGSLALQKKRSPCNKRRRTTEELPVQRFNRRLRVGGDDLEQRPGRAGGARAILFPVLQCPDIHTDQGREL